MNLKTVKSEKRLLYVGILALLWWICGSQITLNATAQNRTNVALKPTDTSAAQKREKQLRQDLEGKNVPIDFYGRFLDQGSNSLPGVKFHLMVRHWDVTAPNLGYSIPIDKVTDAQGRFDVHGVTGDALDMENVVKDGYELEPGDRSFGSVGGSSNNPVIFKMWRTDVHEQLITGSKHIKIIPDGRHYAVDLIGGTFAEAQNSEGDLQIWLKRPEGVQPGQKYYEWSFGIAPKNGGILLEPKNGAPMFAAPTDGYANNFEWTQVATNSGWGSESGDQKFYVKIRGQDYGKIALSVDACFNGNIAGYVKGEARLSIKYSINPSGSTILR
jgi:hypothetical protein